MKKYMYVYDVKTKKRVRVNTKLQFIKQKICGAFLCIAGLVPIFLENDGTAALIFIPMGLYTILYKKPDLFFFNVKNHKI